MEILKRMVKDSITTPLKLGYFYKLKRSRESSYYNLEANTNVTCVNHLKSKAGNWCDTWFFVRNLHNIPTTFRSQVRTIAMK